MEIKVRDLGALEEKSTAEVEQELLEKHEAQFSDENSPEVVEEIVSEPTQISSDLDEEQVLSFLKDRYGKEVNNLDELLEQRNNAPELPEDVDAYFRFKKETGRGLKDFVELNKDYEAVDTDTLLAEYYLATEEGLDADDVKGMVEDLTYDEDLDEESFVRKQKVAKKKVVNKAKKYFSDLQEQYKVPLESSGNPLSGEEKENFEAYQQYVKESSSVQQENTRRNEWFRKQTDEVFSDKFKGFEFAVGEKDVTFNPGNASDLKSAQLDIMNFVNKFIGDDGLIKDAAGYHKALSVAMNPSKFAEFFYEQGKSDGVEDISRKSKNINMDSRRVPETANKDGVQIRSVNSDSGRGLKIKSARRV
jgi:hypothetical protein